MTPSGSAHPAFLFWQAAVSAAADAIVAADRDGRILFLNAPAEQLFGTRAGASAPEHLRDALRKVLGTGVGCQIAGGGKAIPVDKAGAVFVIPVRAEILGRIGEAVSIFDRDWRYVYVNPKGAELARRPPAEIIGECVWDLLPGLRDLPEIQGLIRAAAEQRPVEFEMYYSPFGIWLRVHSYPNPDGAAVIVEDISEPKRALEDLRLANETLSILIDSSPLPITAFDLSGNIFLWNPAAEHVFGWTREEVLGKPLPFIPEEKMAEHRAMRERDLQGQGFTCKEIRRKRKDGSPIDLSVSTAPMHDASGAIRGVMSIYIDITLQKRNERALREAGERFRIALQNSPVTVFNQDRELRYTWIYNPRATFPHDLMLGMTDAEAMPCEETRALEAAKHGVIETGVPLRSEFSLPETDGRHVYDMTFEALRDAQGGIIGVAGAAFDITDRKLLEEWLRQSEGELRLVLDNVPVMISYIDTEHRYQRVNRTYETWYKRSLDHLEGLTILEVVGRAHYERIRPYVERALRGERVNFQTTARGPEGDERELEVVYTPHPDASGVICGFVAFVQDITERKRIQEALREREEWFRLAQRSAAIGIWDWDARTGLVRCSEEYFRIRGRAPSPEPVTTADWLQSVHPEDRGRALDRLQRVLREGGRYESDFRVVWPDGTVRWVAGRGQVIIDREGRPERLIGAVQDITERKQLEEQLQHASKLESLGVLAGGVAHDFNNLLTGIMGNASLAIHRTADDDPLRALLDEILLASHKAAELTRQLLAYAGKGRFVMDRIDCSNLVRENRGLIQSSIPRSVEVKLDLAYDLPPVEADPGQMQQLIMNLVINGAEAINAASGGCVHVRTFVRRLRAEEIAEEFAGFDVKPGLAVAIEVTDTGCGMDGATLSRIFDPFFTTKFTGRGLGLAAALGIVRGHGGGLRVRSTPGQGTSFEVVLPTAVGQPGSDRQVDSDELEVVRGSGTVLVIDDEETVRRTTQALLKSFGYNVLVAEDGRRGVEIFREHAGMISAVLLDLTMPVMSGAETLHALREIRADVPVLVSSGYSELVAAAQLEQGAGARFIQKPYTAPVLAAALREAMGSNGH